MGLESALNSTVSALGAQSNAISAVSENIANASTTAYKIRTVAFQALVGNSTQGTVNGGGVLSKVGQNVAATGQIESTNVSTNIAINGQGFFVVTNSLNSKSSDYDFSRNGDFTPDANGNLENNEGYYLLGQATDNTGKVLSSNANDLNSLAPINVNTIQGAASASTQVTEQLNVPADAAVGDSFSDSFEVYDSLGISSTIQQTFTKTAANGWTMTLGQPALTSDLTQQSGTLAAPLTYNIGFNGNGSLASVDVGGVATSPSMAIDFGIPSATATGAAASTVGLNVGTVGKTDGISQFASNTSTPSLVITAISGNGVRFGKLSSVDIDDTGLVTAVFDNGLRQPVFQIPIATFPNPDGLTQVNGSVYAASQNAGVLSLQNPSVGNAGSLASSALEESNTDISEEFNKLIIAQQAYSAAAQIITTVRTLDDTLNQAIR